MQQFLYCKQSEISYCRLHVSVNALVRNMFSRDVKRLSFRCQTFKFSRPTVKVYFSTLLKGKMILINKEGRNHQKGVPLSTICGIKWKNLSSRDYSFSEVGRRLGCRVELYTSHLGGETSKFDSWNSDVWRHVKTCFARVRSMTRCANRIQSIDFSLGIKTEPFVTL